ncbi:hypothetical protein GOB86_12570 [Acetobacter lambici]|uniref:Uncharacterized protein n=2 Tax=Acetobacter lambici TaxID=1332824 RepID=A0ABT1F5B9_9PROT|nr:hypothetical protein [Acetobacter lambici]MCP1242774.1 hypothetical protein [Acetobacter lambici]MCP1258944.1 hypothetical protein [Acetobacter lambici]NHO57878.1 hypothetical protein [Acetobacter lambici]
MMVQKFCRLTGKLFFVRPRDRKTVHFSMQGKLALNRRQADVDAWSFDFPVNTTTGNYEHHSELSFV